MQKDYFESIQKEKIKGFKKLNGMVFFDKTTQPGEQKTPQNIVFNDIKNNDVNDNNELKNEQNGSTELLESSNENSENTDNTEENLQKEEPKTEEELLLEIAEFDKIYETELHKYEIADNLLLGNFDENNNYKISPLVCKELVNVAKLVETKDTNNYIATTTINQTKLNFTISITALENGEKEAVLKLVEHYVIGDIYKTTYTTTLSKFVEKDNKNYLYHVKKAFNLKTKDEFEKTGRNEYTSPPIETLTQIKIRQETLSILDAEREILDAKYITAIIASLKKTNEGLNILKKYFDTVKQNGLDKKTNKKFTRLKQVLDKIINEELKETKIDTNTKHKIKTIREKVLEEYNKAGTKFVETKDKETVVLGDPGKSDKSAGKGGGGGGGGDKKKDDKKKPSGGKKDDKKKGGDKKKDDKKKPSGDKKDDKAKGGSKVPSNKSNSGTKVTPPKTTPFPNLTNVKTPPLSKVSQNPNKQQPEPSIDDLLNFSNILVSNADKNVINQQINHSTLNTTSTLSTAEPLLNEFGFSEILDKGDTTVRQAEQKLVNNQFDFFVNDNQQLVNNPTNQQEKKYEHSTPLQQQKPAEPKIPEQKPQEVQVPKPIQPEQQTQQNVNQSINNTPFTPRPTVQTTTPPITPPPHIPTPPSSPTLGL